MLALILGIALLNGGISSVSTGAWWEKLDIWTHLPGQIATNSNGVRGKFVDCLLGITCISAEAPFLYPSQLKKIYRKLLSGVVHTKLWLDPKSRNKRWIRKAPLRHCSKLFQHSSERSAHNLGTSMAILTRHTFLLRG